ncbi:UvrD-helicase domain-containing protein, partial [Paenibacillus sp. AR247]|uniref:UvrD-helicase domain-containing protein n=1 Tax=Paenibacillus sp. AR247 TaxID=1631599 RepID=UPI000D40912D
VDWFSGERTDDAVHHLVQRLYDFSRSHSWPDQWLRDMAESFLLPDTASLGESQWVKSILQDARLALAGAEGLLEQARRLTLLPGGPGPYLDNLNADLEVVQSLRDALDNRPWDELFERFQTVSFSKLKSCRKEETDPALQERVKELREAVKKTMQDLKGALFGRPADAFLAELHRAAPLMKELAELVIEFGDRYLHEKQRRNAVDFSDLEHYCLQILRHPDSVPGQPLPSDAAMEYQEQFDEVLLDEYQDTNSVQEDIVKLISRELPGNRFMVGDVKQSIYRFRLAEPSLFLDKYRRYASAEGGGIRIDLARNFRSRLEVVHAVNMVFRQLMNETVAEISYDERAELVYGASYPEAQPEGASGHSPYVPELVLIHKARGGEASEEEPQDSDNGGLIQESEAAEMETAQLEARAIAKKIRALLGDTSPRPMQVFDKETKAMRPVRYGDMVILLRSAYIWGPLIMEELRQLGIPADGEQNQGYFQATEVEIMLSLLQIIDNPRQDIPERTEALAKEQELLAKGLKRQSELQESMKGLEVKAKDRERLNKAMRHVQQLGASEQRLRSAEAELNEHGEKQSRAEALLKQAAQEREQHLQEQKRFAHAVSAHMEQVLGHDSRMEAALSRLDQDEALVRSSSKERELHALSLALAAELRPGEPCPVCGSSHHPAPVSPDQDAPGADDGLLELLRLLRQQLQELRLSGRQLVHETRSLLESYEPGVQVGAEAPFKAGSGPLEGAGEAAAALELVSDPEQVESFSRSAWESRIRK